MTRWHRLVLAPLLALGCLPLTSHAADASASGALPPGWEGVYNIEHGVILDPRVQHDEPDGLVPLNPDHGAAALERLLPWAREEMQASANYSAVDDLSAVCSPDGFFRQPTTVVGWMVLQAPKEVLLVSLFASVGVRRIYLTDRHPANLLPTWNGHSIGHWEGDTLVVDTIGFNDKSWLGSELQPHTEELHVVERIRSVNDGRALEIYTTVDDYKALRGPYSYSRYYRKTQQSFEEAAVSCNPELGDQAIWAYQRQQAILQLERNRRQGGKP